MENGDKQKANAHMKPRATFANMALSTTVSWMCIVFVVRFVHFALFLFSEFSHSFPSLCSLLRSFAFLLSISCTAQTLTHIMYTLHLANVAATGKHQARTKKIPHTKWNGCVIVIISLAVPREDTIK